MVPKHNLPQQVTLRYNMMKMQLTAAWCTSGD